jgi:hypothetical protein
MDGDVFMDYSDAFDLSYHTTSEIMVTKDQALDIYVFCDVLLR